MPLFDWEPNDIYDAAESYRCRECGGRVASGEVCDCFDTRECPQCEGSGVWVDTGEMELSCPRCGGSGLESNGRP